MTDTEILPALEGQVWRYCPTGKTELANRLMYTSDVLAEELPIALEYNGISHATLLATPADLDDLAHGFSATEGIIRTPADIYDIEMTAHTQGITLHITIASACLDALKRRRRTLAGATGCGLCGLESLHDVEQALPPVTRNDDRFTPEALMRASRELKDSQPLHKLTGATHAAGWANRQGELIKVMEDIGRHNALDKLIGWLQRTDPARSRPGFVVMSSRASFEIVQKAAAVNIGTVIAVSAPTAYAIRKAQALNMLLVGFSRDTGFTAYTHPEYLCCKEITL